ncbi:CbtA family protein [Amphibiibacter pelophylacis]|uniref:CbtA family protein n=1 Tax=Amphibiibacter pelophylacis TaxID=1799477 RepID=A0ACC6NYE8_9BURK
MLLRRLIWLALVLALAVGSVQTLLQHHFALPLIQTAETFEDQAPVPPALAHAHEPAQAHDHVHDASAWTPQDGAERTFWTWVANVLENLALALMLLVAFAARELWRGLAAAPSAAPWRVAGVALAGFVGLHLWPSLGLPAELPGAQAADLLQRQMAWGLASVCALLACAVLGWARFAGVWRFALALALLALPFAVGFPHAGDPYAAFGPQAHQILTNLTGRFVGVSHLLAVVQWLALGAGAAWLAPRFLQPLLRPAGLRPAALATGEAR